MDIFLDPNVAYLVLMGGILLALFAAATPGTGLLELSALFCLVLAGYSAYNLSIHWWALGILALSVIPFAFALRGKTQWLFLGLSIILLVIGSLFLYAPDDRLISVNPGVAIAASALVSVGLWFILRKSVEAMSRVPAHNLEALVGQVGVARSDVNADGNVYVAGELWSAHSDAKIPAGSHVLVVRREGFSLVVEKTDRSS